LLSNDALGVRELRGDVDDLSRLALAVDGELRAHQLRERVALRLSIRGVEPLARRRAAPRPTKQVQLRREPRDELRARTPEDRRAAHERDAARVVEGERVVTVRAR